VTEPCLVLSIPHTGTRFVKNHLLRGRVNRYAHIGETQMFEHIAKKYSPIFVPMRHPVETARSWHRKVRDIQGLPALFDLLTTTVNDLAPWYVPIDSKDRDQNIACINVSLGWDLNPDSWPVIGADPYPGTRELDLNEYPEVQESIAKHLQFFSRWYDPETLH